MRPLGIELEGRGRGDQGMTSIPGAMASWLLPAGAPSRSPPFPAGERQRLSEPVATPPLLGFVTSCRVRSSASFDQREARY